MEASRIMNLYQFLQLYKDITSQAVSVLAQRSASPEPEEDASSGASCQASLWMGRYAVPEQLVAPLFHCATTEISLMVFLVLIVASYILLSQLILPPRSVLGFFCALDTVQVLN